MTSNPHTTEIQEISNVIVEAVGSLMALQSTLAASVHHRLSPEMAMQIALRAEQNGVCDYIQVEAVDIFDLLTWRAEAVQS